MKKILLIIILVITVNINNQICLAYNFEENSLDKSTEYFVQHQLITNEQIKCYQQYLKYRLQDKAAREKARFDSEYADWTPSEIENLINRLMELRKNKGE